MILSKIITTVTSIRPSCCFGCAWAEFACVVGSFEGKAAVLMSRSYEWPPPPSRVEQMLRRSIENRLRFRRLRPFASGTRASPTKCRILSKIQSLASSNSRQCMEGKGLSLGWAQVDLAEIVISEVLDNQGAFVLVSLLSHRNNDKDACMTGVRRPRREWERRLTS